MGQGHRKRETEPRLNGIRRTSAEAPASAPRCTASGKQRVYYQEAALFAGGDNQ